ncbi:MAG: DUF6754 domain-containing protein [Chloroflexota bacterium]
MSLQIVIAILLLLTMLLFLASRQIRLGRSNFRLRPLPAYEKLSGQVGRAVESGQKLHISLGQAGVTGAETATSIAATQFLSALAKDSCANNTPPIVTVGNGTLLPLAENQIRNAYDAADRLYQYQPNHAQFIAQTEDNFAFAAGVTSELMQNKVLSHVLAGRYGAEIGIIGEAANRQNIQQIIATDDPTALAIGTAVSENVIIGEELFAAGAYIKKEPSQIASLQVQDLLRWVIAITIVGVTIFQFVTQ